MRFAATNFNHIRNFFDTYYGIRLNTEDRTLQTWNSSIDNGISFMSDMIGNSFGRESLEVFEGYLKAKQQYELSPTNELLKKNYEDSLRKLSIDAEERMSSLRSELSPYLKINPSGAKLEDKFVYGYLSASKTKEGFDNLEMHFLDAKKVLEAESNFKLRQRNEGGSITLHQNRGFKPEDWISLAADFQTLGFSDDEIGKMIQIQNAVGQQNISEMLVGIAGMQRSEVDTRKVGLGRAYDFTFRDQNMDILDQLTFQNFKEEYNPAMLSENMPGVLAPDAMIVTGSKVVSISLKSQVNGSATLDHTKSAMIESLYLAFSRQDLLEQILTPGQRLHNEDIDTQTLLNAVSNTLESDPEAKQQFMDLVFEEGIPEEMVEEE